MTYVVDVGTIVVLIVVLDIADVGIVVVVVIDIIVSVFGLTDTDHKPCAARLVSTAIAGISGTVVVIVDCHYKHH